MHVNKSERKLLPMSRIAPGRNDAAEIDTVVSAKRYGDRRAFDILMDDIYIRIFLHISFYMLRKRNIFYLCS